MKKSILFILILCGLFFKGIAQNASSIGSISGSVIDSLSKATIDYAVISLIPAGKTTPVNGTTTDAKGHFSINNIPAGDYAIKVTFLGYRDAMRNSIHVDQQNISINLGTIALAPVSHMLHDVSITAKRPTIQNKVDKLVYDPSNDLTAQGGSAVDILKKVPMVTVDIDGNIELLGSPGINFLINGKPSSMFGTSLADALQTIPASQIKNIEVITNPGAKYDAQGTGGIINIILKDSNLQGVNGTVNLAAGTRLTNGSFNLNARKNNFGVNAFFSGNDQYNTNSLNTKILTNAAGVPVLNQQGNSRINRKGYQSGLNFDWKLSKYDDLTAMIGYNRLSNHTYGLTSQSQTTFDNSGTVSMLNSGRNSDSRLNQNTIQWSMGYKKTFKKENQELDVLYQSNISNNRLNYSQLQQYDNNVQLASGNMSNAPGKIHETSVEVNYTQPISKNFTIETGGKGFFKTIENQTSFFRFDPNLGQYVVDPTQANNFRYDRNIYAYYLSANFKAFNYLNVKLGGRYEYTYTKSDFAHIPGYGTFNPTLLIARQLDESQLIKISYSHRIERPDYGVLNPFVDRSDPYNIFTGNPLLNPEIGNNFELGYSKSFKQGANLNITAFYRKNSNDIQSYTVFYPTYDEAGVVYDNVSFTQRINTGAEIRAGGNISASLPVSNNFNLRTNILIAHKSVLYDYQGLNQDTRGMEYRVNLNAAYDFSKSLSAEAFANYNSPRIGLQGTYPSFFYYTLAVKKTFWHNNASIGVSATDPFNAYINQTSNIIQNGNRQYYLRQIPYRSFGITLSYKFGKLKISKPDDQQTDPVIPTL